MMGDDDKSAIIYFKEEKALLALHNHVWWYGGAYRWLCIDQCVHYFCISTALTRTHVVDGILDIFIIIHATLLLSIVKSAE